MKVTYVLAASLLLSLSAFAQKDELKALKKLNDKGEATQTYAPEFKSLLDKAEPLVANATNDQKADFYFYKAQYAVGEAKKNPNAAATLLPTAIDDYNKVIELEKAGKQNHTKAIQGQIYPAIKVQVEDAAAAVAEKKMYKEAGQLYELAYKVDNKDNAMLYNSAAMAVNAKDYDSALKNYLELEKQNFTGIVTTYSAKSKASGKVENFPNQTTMDLSVKQGLYSEPKVEKSPSLKGDIVKNIALIYSQKGEIEKAKQAMSNARKANPDDTSLIIGEAELYLKTKDMAKYKELITEAAAKNPNDATLFYNLGVVSTEADPAGAEGYFKKALAIDPNNFDALVGIGALQLNGEKKIVEEMNKLGTSAKDNQRFEVLKKKKDGLYTSALPYFEKAHKLKEDNQYVISVLSGLYQALDRTTDYKAMKAKQKA
jgi:tetratricopeptide (TPR) repeat protein